MPDILAEVNSGVNSGVRCLACRIPSGFLDDANGNQVSVGVAASAEGT
jgi:hypothetical protein